METPIPVSPFHPWHRILTDAALVERARHDDAAAFEELVRRHQRSAHAVAAALGVPCSNRDDVVQESFLRAFRGLPGMEQGQKFGAWLRQIARRESLRSLERSPRNAAVDDLDVAAGEPPDDVAGAELRERVLRSVRSLPLELREAIFAYYYEGLSTRSAARSLGISVSMLKHRLQRSREVLRVRLGREVADELGIPLAGRTAWDRRARALSLVVLAASPALRPSLASAAGAAAAGPGAISTHWIQAGIMSIKNIAISLSLTLAIAGAVAIWWFASGGPRNDAANLRGERPPSSAAPAGAPQRDPRIAAAGDAAAGTKAPEKTAAAELPPRGPQALQGRVLDLRGQPVAGARVVPVASDVLAQAMRFSQAAGRDSDPFTQMRLLREDIHRRLDGTAEAVTDDAGRYSFAKVAAGEHRVLVIHPAFLPLTDAWVDVARDGTSTRDVTLEDAQRIRGRVLALDGSPIAGATVSVQRAERRGVKGIGSAMAVAITLANGMDLLGVDSSRTGKAGEFELGSLEPGLHDVRAVHEGYLVATLENVDAGSTIDLRLSPARALRGRITDSAGKPIPPAMVTLRVPRPAEEAGNPLTLLAADVDLRDERTRSARCSEDGAFVLYPPQSGVYEILIQAPRFLEARRVERLGERDVDLGKVVLDAGRRLSGVVLSASGAPANARVSARRARASRPSRSGVEELADTRTGEGGAFELGPLPADDLVVTAVDEALGSVDVEHHAGDPSTLELRIPAGEVVEGVVVDASSQQPIAGASLTWSAPPIRQTTSAEDGTFRFAGMPADLETRYGGAAFINATHPRYRYALSKEAWTRGKPLKISLEPRPIAHGVVVDASGSPVRGARVAIEVPGLPQDFLLVAGEVSGGVFSGAEGRFEVQVGLPQPGNAGIDIVAAHPALGRGRARMVLEGDEDLRIELKPAASFAATVRDASGAPVKQARVALERSAVLPPDVALLKGLLPGLASAAGFTDEGGRVTLRAVEPGKYDVVASAAGYAVRRQAEIEVLEDGASIDLVLERGRDLSGRVVDKLLAPVPGAEVVAFDPESPGSAAGAAAQDEEREVAAVRDAAAQGHASATTDPQGRFTLSDLAPGKYRLIVRGERILPAQVEAAEPGRQLPDIQVERWATLVVQVREAGTGAPLTSFQVTVSPQSMESRTDRGTEEVSSSEGKFERGRIPAGPVGIEVRAAGHAPWLGIANVQGGARREVQVYLYPSRRVEGLIRSAVTQEPIAGATVTLRSRPSPEAELGVPGAEALDGRWFQAGVVTTDAAGRFAIADGREGEFRIGVEHPEFYDLAAETRPPVVIGAGDLELAPVDLAPGSAIQVTIDGWTAPDERSGFICVDAFSTAPAPRPELRASKTAVIDPTTGKCRISGLPPGTYELSLRSFGAEVRQGTPPSPVLEGGPRALGTVTVGERETAELTARAQAR